MRLYAIGDIHGQREALLAAHDRIHSDGGRDALIVHVGDLIDRGPDSRGVVDYLLQGQAKGRPWIVLRGNHDRFLSAFLERPDWIDPSLSSRQHWLDDPGLGAAETLASYGVDIGKARHRVLAEARRAVPERHRRFLAALQPWYLHPLALAVHAGIRPGVGLLDQSEDDLLWVRHGFLESDLDFGPLVVHGHTSLFRATHYGNRLNIDSGAGHGRALSAVVIEPGEVHLLGDTGREQLVPTRSMG
ncbi:MAG: metallophosphoesterase [Paracoccus sp. (in: a-proteobacteria)]|nr:metallophosphoesterase [Paracoccus sp. (in: a-proteobacteria)]